MEVLKIFEFLRDEIHTVVMATAGEDGNPVTCAIDIMDCDAGGLYFLTARGKNFYSRLKARPNISLTGIAGDSTLTRVAVSVSGRAEELGWEGLSRLLDKNAYMYKIYPTELSRRALCAFKLCEGSGEVFDLTKTPVERFSFSFGGSASAKSLNKLSALGYGQGGGYIINEKCSLCGRCLEVCPQNCISLGSMTAKIAQNNCLRCGNCMAVCPSGAVKRQ